MPCTQDFLNNAKIVLDGIDRSDLWLVDFNAKVATYCALSRFTEGDLRTIETPSNALYQLLMQDCPWLATNSRIAANTQEVRFVNQVAIQQSLSNAIPLLAALIKGDAILKAVGQPGHEPDDLVEGALRYVDMLYSEVQK